VLDRSALDHRVCGLRAGLMAMRDRARPRLLAALACAACGLDTFGGSGAGGDGSAAGPGTSTDDPTTSATGDSSSPSTLTGDESPPVAPALQLVLSPIKQFDFTWSAAAGATHYRLLERLPGAADYLPLGAEITGESLSVTMPLHLRFAASYRLSACNGAGCTDSDPVDVVDSMVAAIGYLKASNPDQSDNFGVRVALSADGDTLAVAADREDSAASGIDGDAADDSLDGAGAVYVFVRDDETWTQQAYVKPSNPDVQDYFGSSLALSADGGTLAVGAWQENGAAVGINGDEADDSLNDTGAAYVFVRVGQSWSQQAYVKASNTGEFDRFGASVALSADGDTLAVGAENEGSAATGIDGDETDDSLGSAGAVYVYLRNEADVWSQQAYIKPSNTCQPCTFGHVVALSSDGNTLAVASDGETSASTGINGDQSDQSLSRAGAVYVFVRAGAWTQQAYIKASNTDADDYFGHSLSLSGDGDTLAVGAYGEDSAATGVGGDQLDDSVEGAGAAYVFTRLAGVWSQQAYIKASRTAENDIFGYAVALAGDGETLAVGARQESSAAIGVEGEQADEMADISGAVYVFIREADTWTQRAHVKASNTGMDDRFGSALALASDGTTLAVGAESENSGAVGVGGDQLDDTVDAAGAVYLY
jgi:hypothetical protein